jgi:hypothetical protein
VVKHWFFGVLAKYHTRTYAHEVNMVNLVSPGVQVQIQDESFYASSGPGTVPFIMISTAGNKSQPGNTTAIAPGTVPENADKLYLITSQRELLQTFGNPRFYTQAGTPQYGNELNELGLYTAYQYLGIANRAWVMRANIDLDQLRPRGTAPVGEPRNGDVWWDLQSTQWGMFRSNGNINSGLAWGAVQPIVISDVAQMQRIVQGRRTAPQRGRIIDANTPVISSAGAGELRINSVPVQMNAGWSLLRVIQQINTNTSLQQRGIRAELHRRVEKVDAVTSATVYNLRLVCADPLVEINMQGTVGAHAIDLLKDLGMVNNVGDATAFPRNHHVPVDEVGSPGSLAVNALGYLDVATGTQFTPSGVQMFEKIASSTDDGTFVNWHIVGSTDAQTPGWGWTEATPTRVTGTATAPVFNPGDAAQIYVGGVPMGFTNSGVTLSAFASDLNAAFDAAQVNVLATVISTGAAAFLRITNFDGTDIQLVDQIGSPFGNLGFRQDQIYYGEVTGTSADPTFFGDAFTIQVGSLTSAAIAPTGDVQDAADAINADPVLGVPGIITAEVVSVGVERFLRIINNNGTQFSIRNGTGYSAPAAPLVLAGIPTGATFGNQLIYQSYSVQTPQPKNLRQVSAGNIWINTVPGNRGANFRLFRYNAGIDDWQLRQAPLYANDATADAAFGGNRTVGTIYVRFNSEATVNVTAYAQPRIWTGTSWQPAHVYASDVSIMYTQSMQEPTGAPEPGALWYSTNLRTDILVSNGVQWMGYRNMYPATDPAGTQLSATEPSYQSDGVTPLVDNDLWIDTSDLENYPKLYRYDASAAMWNLVDVTDQSSSQGIVFGDVRPNATGTASGSEAPADMLVSNYVDPDAPAALVYPFGMLAFNTRYSTFNVKQWRPNYLSTGSYTDRWVTVSGNAGDGSPLMGRKAQRIMVVRAQAAALVSNQEIRSESNFFNLIAAPGYPELIDEMVNLNTDKKDVAFVVVDPPARLTPDGTSVQAWATNSNNAPSNGEDGLITTSRYAGVYYPWGLATNLDGSEIFVPPSMAVLRTLAFNDQVAYPWFAPAGFNRGLVSAVTSVGYLNAEAEYVPVQLSQGQRDVLYTNKINPIAFIPGRGLVIYGQRTLNPVDSALDRVNVARLINYLNYQLDNLAKPFLFEPNDEFTRDSVTRTFESFLGDLVGLRALFDYAVLCDETVNTPERIDRNELWVEIACKPTKSIEFIYIPLRILNTGDPLPT